MNLTVIIPTYNGRNKIGDLLLALGKQTFQEFRVIIMIDGSTDDTHEFLENNDWDLDLNIYQQENQGRARVRNNAVRLAGDNNLLVFFDDDMRPSEDCLLKHVEHHQHYPESILVGAQLENVCEMETDFQKFKAHLSRKWMSEVSVDHQGREISPFITAAHFSIHKKTFDALGGFDDRLSDAEDYDLAVRSFQANVPIYFDRDLIAYHEDLITCESYVRRLRQYRKAIIKLHDLKPEFIENIYAPPKRSRYWKKYVYNLFARQLWIKLVDKSNILLLMPRLIRYRLYDWIITGLSVYYPDRKV